MFPQSSLIGIAVGLGFALIDYLILLPLLERPLRAELRQAPPAEKERVANRIRLIRFLFTWQFLVFPVVGYLVGRLAFA